jgi:hypothetical protein
MSGSRGEANFVWKCKNCKVALPIPSSPHHLLTSFKREHSASIKAPPAAYAQTDPPKTVNILEFDCRGLEFTEFKAEVRTTCANGSHASELTWLQGEFLATGAETGTKFAGIDLAEDEWFDYDEKAGEEVSITGVKWEIRRA